MHKDKTGNVDHAALEKGRDDARYPGKDRRYAALDTFDLPLTESLKQTIERVLPYWYSNVLPAVQAGKRCIIVGHGNSIRVSQVCASIVSMLCFVTCCITLLSHVCKNMPICIQPLAAQGPGHSG